MSMPKKFNLVLLFVAVFFSITETTLTAAPKVPKSKQEISKHIEITEDTFKGITRIETKPYISRQGFSDRFPVTIHFRSVYKGGDRLFIQLYVESLNTDWGYYHSANGEDGYSFKFEKIAEEVEKSKATGLVLTDEHYALELSIEYLENMAKKDWKIKVYGKKNEGVFVVPQQLSSAYLQKLIDYENGISEES